MLSFSNSSKSKTLFSECNQLLKLITIVPGVYTKLSELEIDVLLNY